MPLENQATKSPNSPAQKRKNSPKQQKPQNNSQDTSSRKIMTNSDENMPIRLTSVIEMPKTLPQDNTVAVQTTKENNKVREVASPSARKVQRMDVESDELIVDEINQNEME